MALSLDVSNRNKIFGKQFWIDQELRPVYDNRLPLYKSRTAALGKTKFEGGPMARRRVGSSPKPTLCHKTKRSETGRRCPSNAPIAVPREQHIRARVECCRDSVRTDFAKGINAAHLGGALRPPTLARSYWSNFKSTVRPPRRGCGCQRRHEKDFGRRRSGAHSNSASLIVQ